MDADDRQIPVDVRETGAANADPQAADAIALEVVHLGVGQALACVHHANRLGREDPQADASGRDHDRTRLRGQHAMDGRTLEADILEGQFP